MQFDWMIFDAETNVLSSYPYSLQVYTQEFGMRMRRLLGGAEHVKAKTKRLVYLKKKELLLYLLCSFSILNHIKTLENSLSKDMQHP